MNFTCPREGLLSALQIAATAMPSKTVNSVLDNFKLTAVAGKVSSRVTASATDNEVGAAVTLMGVEVRLEGTVLLPQRVVGMLRESNSETISIEQTFDEIKIVGDRFRCQIPLGPAEKFPAIEGPPEGVYHEVAAKEVCNMVRKSSFSVAKAGFATEQGTRYGATCGIQWELTDTVAACIATQGGVAAIVSGFGKSVGGHKTDAGSVAITKFMDILERAAAAEDDDQIVQVTFTKNKCWAVTPRTTVSGVLMGGQFPNVRRIIPKEPESTVKVKKGDFLSAVKQVIASATDELDSQRVSLEFTEHGINLNASSVTGQCFAEIDASVSKPFEIVLNPRKLADVLKQFAEGEVSIDYATKPERIVFRDEHGIYLLAGMVSSTGNPK